MTDIEVFFPGGKRVDAHVGKHVVRTDQPADAGGDDSAVGPFDLFLASLATCSGFYVLGFCQARELPLDGISLRQHVESDPTTKLPTSITLTLTLPESFPERYRVAIGKAAESCKVKKTLAASPTVTVRVEVGATSAP